MNAFASIFLVVPISIDDLAQRFFILCQEGPTWWFSNIVGFIELFVMDLDVANIAVVFLVESVMPHNTKALNAFARSFNIVPGLRQLKTTTDSKDHTIVVNKALEVFFFIW